MAAFSSCEVKIAGTGDTVYTTIADSSDLVISSIYKVYEIIRDRNVGIFDDEQIAVPEVVGLGIECCGDDDDDVLNSFPNTSINTNNKVATLQLCYGSCGILIQLLLLKDIPNILRELLADDKGFNFVGVGIRDALAKLERDYGLKCNSGIELGPVVSRVCKKSQFFDSSLEELAREIAGINIDEKPTISNPTLSWGARDLRIEQIDYAMTKAYASYSIGKKLMRREVKK